MKDPYASLGVSKSASAEEIKKTYRRLAKKLHPDVNPGDKKAEERFKEVSGAFEILGDPKKRALYDEFGEIATRPGFDEAKARAWQRQAAAGGGGFEGFPPGAGGGFGGFSSGGFDPEDLSSMFSEFFGRRAGAGRGRRTRAEPVAGEDTEAGLEVELREAVLGAEREISLDRPVRCPECGGTGTRAGGRQACPRCGGAGTVSEQARLKVRIPPGVETGSRVRLPGQGGAGAPGAPPGDLYLRITVRPHPAVRVEGRDLYFDLPVTVAEALSGAEVRVPTFEGSVKLKVPAGSQSGRKLRLRGRGLPPFKGGATGATRGDLYVVLQVVLPDDSPESREAAGALQRLYKNDVRKDVVL